MLWYKIADGYNSRLCFADIDKTSVKVSRFSISSTLFTQESNLSAQDSSLSEHTMDSHSSDRTFSIDSEISPFALFSASFPLDSFIKSSILKYF